MLPILELVLGAALIIEAQLIMETYGHGRLLEPPARNTLWRFGFKAPPNYNDNELFCGGIGVSKLSHPFTANLCLWMGRLTKRKQF